MCFPFKDWPDPSQLKRLKYQLLFCFSQANVHQHSLRNSLVTYINSYLVALGHTSLKYSKGECFNQYRRSKWAPHSAVLRHQLNSLKQMFSQLVNLVHTRIARTRAKDKEVASQRCLTLTDRWSHQSRVAFRTFFFCICRQYTKCKTLELSVTTVTEKVALHFTNTFHQMFHFATVMQSPRCRQVVNLMYCHQGKMMLFRRSNCKHSQRVGLSLFNWDYTTAKDRTDLELPSLELQHFQIWKVQRS